MTIFEIRNAAKDSRNLLGFLFYFEHSRRFFAELLEEIDEWECPFIFSSFVKNGEYSIDSEWSMKFVMQRIIPPDRQNIGDILRDNRLSSYDEYRLLLLSEGRCAQDELYLVKTDIYHLPDEITERINKKVRDVIPLSEGRVLVFFRDDTSGIVCISHLANDNKTFHNIINNPTFYKVRVSPGGNGIEWGSNRFISSEKLYNNISPIPISYDDILNFIRLRVPDTTEISLQLNCSRQYINQLVREGRLHPVKNESNNKIFLQSEIEGELY